MKFLCLIVLVLAALKESVAHPPGEMIQKMKAMIEECKTSEKVPDGDIALLMDKKLPISQEGMCFVGCMFEACGIFKAGEYHAEQADELVKRMFAGNPDMMKKMQATHAACDKPAESSGKDKCKNGIAFLQCLKTNLPDFQLLPKMPPM